MQDQYGGPGVPVRSDAADSHLSFVVVSVSGEVDIATAPAVGAELADVLAEGRVRAVVDLSAVTFLDSSGLAVLVGAHNQFKAAGGQVRLVVTDRRVRMPLEVTGLINVVAVYDSLALAEADWLGDDLQPTG